MTTKARGRPFSISLSGPKAREATGSVCARLGTPSAKTSFCPMSGDGRSLWYCGELVRALEPDGAAGGPRETDRRIFIPSGHLALTTGTFADSQ